MTDLASLMADEPVLPWCYERATYPKNGGCEALRLLEAREQALLARVSELEALLASLYAPIQTTFGATLEGRTQE